MRTPARKGFRAGVLFLLQISIIQRILKAAITVKISVKGNHVMTKKKKRSSGKALHDDKWYFDTSHRHIEFVDSENINHRKYTDFPLRDKINKIVSLNYILQRQTSYLSVLRKQEAQAISPTKNGSEYKNLYQQIKQQEQQIEETQKHIKSLEQQIQAFYSLEKKSAHDHATSPTAPSSPPIQSVYYPSINVGDYLYHRSYGNGIVYFKADSFCRVLFSDSLFKTFSYKDDVFKDKTLIISNAWDRTHGKYTHPFSYSADSIPSPLQPAYATFIEGLSRDLSSSISKLRLYTKNYASTSSSGFYAQRALDCIYNIEHGPQVFLSLQSKIAPPAQKQPAPAPPKKRTPIASSPASIPAQPAPSLSALSLQYKPSTDTLYVYSGRIRCIRDKHNIVCANAHIETASGETAILNVNCCLNCNRFYISYDEYSRYMEKYKSLLTRIVLVDENGNSSFTNNFAAESTLKLCGYTVSQEKGFTSKERANLLANIIHNRIVSKSDVIQHLNWLIRMNGKKAGNDIAKEKWEEDLAFVRSLDTNTQSDYQIRHVAPYSSSKKRRK